MACQEKTKKSMWSTEHQPEAVACHPHVSEEEAGLHEPVHACLELEIVYTVGKDEKARAPAAHDSAPTPVVVFQSELKVRHGHSDEAGDDEQDEKDKGEDPIERVQLMAPHRRKDVIQLDVDCAEGQ